MKILITGHFKRAAKALHRNQTAILEKAIQEIASNPVIGDAKVGDLAGVRVYKFHIQHQLILLAYRYNDKQSEVTLLYFSSHENFYTTLKKQIS